VRKSETMALMTESTTVQMYTTAMLLLELDGVLSEDSDEDEVDSVFSSAAVTSITAILLLELDGGALSEDSDSDEDEVNSVSSPAAVTSNTQ